MHIQLFTYQWRKLEPEVRNRLVEIFGIQRSGRAVVVSLDAGKSDVQSDGYLDKDLEVITLERLNEFLGSEETDFYEALKKVIEKIHAENKAQEQVEGGTLDGGELQETAGGSEKTSGADGHSSGEAPRKRGRKNI